jgi:GTP-binding protein EngB required for normal cell division
MDLREYEQSKFAIAEILRSTSACLPEREEELRVRLQDLFARLAEDRFNLVVLGRFNRGKTSLMNAILRTDRLPIGIVPLTSVITTVGYGSKEQVVLKYDNRILDHEIPIEALPQHITQQGNPGNVQRIKTAEVQLPAEVLRRGFYFVDTPGLGSVIVENTFTTEAFLPEADALILVTSYESPLSEDEVRFFKAGASSGRRVFVVLNKHDTVSLEQRKIALAYVREQLGILFGDSIVPILSVSSTDGLNAKLSGDQRLLEASGLPELEQQLLDFLLTEKSSEFLRLMCHRAQQFLKELPNRAEVVDLIARIDALSQQFVRKTQARSTQVSVPAVDFPNLHQLQSCEICAQVTDKLWNFLCKYQYDIIISRDEQQRFANRGGLCPFHSWQLWSVSSPYGICAAHAPLFERLAAALRESASTQRLTQIHARLHDLLPDEHDCALCNVRDRAEEDAIDSLAKRLARNKTRALDALSAICLPHFVMLASAVHDGDLVRTMLKRQATVLERYSENMKRYAIKHAGVRQYLASEEETTAAERGLLLVAGRRQVNFVSRHALADVDPQNGNRHT